MHNYYSDRGRAAPARGFMALFAIMLGMGLGLMASPAEAAPFAYVTNVVDGTVSVIDTATNMVMTTLTMGFGGPVGVAVTPDGKHAYVTTNGGSNNVSVIDTATNMVMTTLTVGTNPTGVAVTPVGKRVYVTNLFSNNVSVIDTATNTVVGSPIPVGSGPIAVAVTTDGKHAYVVNNGSNNVSVIGTATNTVEAATIPVGTSPQGVAVTPDGKHAYVTNVLTSGHVVVNGTVSVIDTATNTVEAATIGVGRAPVGVGIMPPPVGIDLDRKPNKDRFELLSSFTLGSASNGINPVTEAVTLRVGTFTTTIPPGSFKDIGQGIFVFHGVIGGVRLEALLKQTGTRRYAFRGGGAGR
jgi:YVTN family beta-propeller protein